MGFYGSITNNTKSQFSFDKIYPNRATMDDSVYTDGIFVGRFVLVDYDKDDEVVRQVYKKEKDVNNYLYSDATCLNAIQFNKKGATFDGELLTGVNKDDICFVNDGLTNIYYQCYGSQKEGNIDYALFRAITNIPIDQKWNYSANYEKDEQRYNGNIGRGWDSTVWQKLYENGEEKYAQVAELNAVVPTFDLSVDAPSIIPTAPHFDEVSNSNYYEIHWQPQWGLRVKSANKLLSKVNEEDVEKGGAELEKIYSDETTTWVKEVYNTLTRKNELYYYSINEEWVLIEKLEDIPEEGHLPADIYFNKLGFSSDVHFRSSMEDNISLSPTGYSQTPTFRGGITDWSDTLYNDHTRGEKVKKEDTQELSMLIPSLGNAVNEMWDLVYGKGVDEEGKKLTEENIELNKEYNRLKFVGWEDGSLNTHENRLRLIDKDSTGYITYQPEDAETLAGAINSAHDLMGMIIVDTTKFETPFDMNDQAQLEGLDGDKIYFLSNVPKKEEEGEENIEETPEIISNEVYYQGYYRKATDYKYESVDYKFIPFEKEVIREIYEPRTYYVKDENGSWIDDTYDQYSDDREYAKKIIDTDDGKKYKVYESVDNLGQYAPGKFFSKEGNDYINDDSLAAREVTYYSIDETKIEPENIIENYIPNIFHKVVEEDAYVKAYTGKNKYIIDKYYIYNKKTGDFELCKDEIWTKGKIYYYIDENLQYQNAYVTKEENLYEKDKYYIHNGTEYVKCLEEDFNESLTYYQLVKKDNYYICSDETIEENEQKYYKIDSRENSPVLNMYYSENGRVQGIQDEERDSLYFWVPQAFAVPIRKDIVDENGDPVRDEEGNIQTELVGFTFTAPDDVLDEEGYYCLLNWDYGKIKDPITGEEFEGAVVDSYYHVNLINFDENQNYYYYDEETQQYTRVLYDNIAAEYADLGALRSKDISRDNVSYLKKNVYTIRKTGKEDPIENEEQGIVIPYTYKDFYFKDKFYYEDKGNYLLDTSDTLYFEIDENGNKILREYLSFLDGAVQKQEILFYMPNKYYWYDEKENRYKLDKDLIMKEDIQYYVRNDLYVKEDLLGLYPVGAVWNRAAEFVPCSIEIATRTPKYKMIPLDGFGSSLNTINGLILNINKLLLQGDYHTRDRNTVQGVINTANDIINRFNHLVPGQLLTTDLYGRVHSTPFANEDNKWININLNSYPDSTFIKIEHKNADTVEPIEKTNIELAFGDTFTIEDLHFDEKGHKSVSTEHTIKIPQGSLSDDTKTGSDLITQLTFEPTSGKISTTRENVGSLKLNGYSIPTSGLVTGNNTINEAFNLLDAGLVKEIEDREAAVKAEETARAAAILKEQTDRATAIQQEQTDRAAAILQEQNDRNTAIENKIKELDVEEKNVNSYQTISKISETDGKISVTLQNISISSSAINDKDSSDDAVPTRSSVKTLIGNAINGLGGMASASTDSYFTKSDINDILEAYVKTSTLNDNYLTSADIASTYATIDSLNNNYLTKSEITEDYISKTVYEQKISDLESEIKRLEELIKSYHSEIPSEPTE